MKSRVLPLFPSVIHVVEVENYPLVKDRVLKFIYEEQKKDPQGRSVSNLGGWQSKDTYAQEDNILRHIVEGSVYGYFRNAKIWRDGIKIRLGNMWININKRGNSNSLHTHPGSELSGVMWIKSSPNCGNLLFDSPHMYYANRELMSFSEKFQREYNSYGEYWFVPTEGNIVIFPSYQYHSVEPSDSDEDRISISFNLSFSE